MQVLAWAEIPTAVVPGALMTEESNAPPAQVRSTPGRRHIETIGDSTIRRLLPQALP
jgi:hypothetical protein